MSSFIYKGTYFKIPPTYINLYHTIIFILFVLLAHAHGLNHPEAVYACDHVKTRGAASVGAQHVYSILHRWWGYFFDGGGAIVGYDTGTGGTPIVVFSSKLFKPF